MRNRQPRKTITENNHRLHSIKNNIQYKEPAEPLELRDGNGNGLLVAVADTHIDRLDARLLGRGGCVAM
jgi:hypothetical protein